MNKARLSLPLRCIGLILSFEIFHTLSVGSSAVAAERDSTMSKMMNSAASGMVTKRLFLLRHGQAMHNPRAEKARAEGCSHETFLKLMQEDDVLDAELTELGKAQAIALAKSKVLQEKLKGVKLVISSPLSRALETAECALPLRNNPSAERISIENFREINGWLLNAKRKPIQTLRNIFKDWDFTDLESEEDTLWTPSLESEDSCGERGYQGKLLR